ncbi:MAG: DUF1460 domain-containing protein [Ignavibacteria bacterium]|nr:DUF1460 domain-containing protein [Ignavibacteria bacterium]
MKDKSKRINVGFFHSYTLLFTLYSLLFSSTGCAQESEDVSVQIYDLKFQLAVDEKLSAQPINEVIVEIGKSFIGTDYVAHTLEVNDEEKLVINLSALDCNTFVENVLALSRCIKQSNTSFDDFQDDVKLMRYRDGKIDQYPSRLHYFTDWIFNNEEKGIVKNITEEIGGEILELNISFMSSHPEYYRHLKAKSEFISLIKKQEEEINKREHFFIAQEQISEIEQEIESGDLLAFTSTITGLDVNHVGIAVRMDDDRIHVLHAPNVGYKVQISKLPLTEYVNNIEKNTGVIVVRVLEPAEHE